MTTNISKFFANCNIFWICSRYW